MTADSAVRAVVAFPTFEVADRQWVESIRAKHDPEAKRIAAARPVSRNASAPRVARMFRAPFAQRV